MRPFYLLRISMKLYHEYYQKSKKDDHECDILECMRQPEAYCSVKVHLKQTCRGDPIGVNLPKNRSLVRRGEGGWERWGGPLWTLSGGQCGPRVGRLNP